MPSIKLTAVAFASLALLGTAAALAQDIVVDPAIASMTADQKVAARQAAMKQDGKLLKGAGNATGQAAIDLATTVVQNFTNFPALFADGATNSDSEALPLVWTEFDKFTGIFDKGRAAAQDMLVAAQAGDADKFNASIKALGGACFECHQIYRAAD